MAARPPIELTVDQRPFVLVAHLMKAEADGKDLRKDLLREFRSAAAPLVVDLRAAINSMPSSGVSSPALRPAIAKAIRPVIRLSGKNTGVSIRAGQTPNIRGFKNAARRMNRSSFRHPVFGGSPWVTQVGKPRWWEDTTAARKDEFREKVLDAVEAMADRIATRG